MPNGSWTTLLIGAHWPDSSTLETLAAGSRNRHAVGTAFDSYAEALRLTSRGALGCQEGTTAQDARDAFAAGELHARTVAEKNFTRKTALERAHAVATEFRSQLAEIAERGNSGIQAILDSKQDRHHQVARIAKLVAQAQTEANIRAAACSQEMLGSIQSVLDHSRGGRSARDFAAAQGIDLHKPYRATHPETVRRQVEGVLSATRPGVPQAHGGDVRPSPTPAATPGAARSASVAAGSNGTGSAHRQLVQPAVIRHQSLIAPAGIVRSHAAERGATPNQRLRRLLDMVARQEPLLRWMIGEREDHRVILATDLADGWIPPNIDIPAGIGLPAPTSQRDNLLGPVTHSLTYHPGQHLPPPETELTFSPDARRTEPITDLGSRLAVAVDRAGLAEMDPGSVARAAMDSYPTAVDATAVANWQLLAASNAFTKGEVMLANYHFTWFQSSR